MEVATNVEDEVKKTDVGGVTMTHSNLTCFLNIVTPIVHTYIDAKVPFLPLQNINGEKVADGIKYFYLADLWNQFYEWSACGVGTSVCLPLGEAIVQYFVPYLSAIQLYTNKSGVAVPQRSLGWHSNNNEVQGTSFDAYNKHVMKDSHIYKPGDEGMASIWKEELFFSYIELDSPYERLPFADKMYELCCKFPDILSLRSIDISPSSWMSVFWHPLSHVPVRNKKDLGTCFLTYHSISTSKEYRTLDAHASNYMALAPFGLATHKMETEIWASPDSGDQEHVASLINTTHSWIQKCNIQHHDFKFFSNCSFN